MIIPVLDHIHLSLESALRDKTSGGVYIPSHTHKEEKAQSIATVKAVGALSELGIVPGDKVFIHYGVSAQHTVNKDGTTTFHNKFDFGWHCERPEWIYAVWRDGMWRSLGDWVLMREVWEPSVLDEMTPEEVAIVGGMVGRKLMKGVGDMNGVRVYFSERFRATYDVEGVNYVVLPKRLVTIDRDGVLEQFDEEDKSVSSGLTGVGIKAAESDDVRGGLIVPEVGSDYWFGEVMGVGQRVRTVSVGDTVYYRRGTDAVEDGGLLWLKERELLGKKN